VALLWSLVLSGIFPTPFRLIWETSAPRWAIEAVWINEVGGRRYDISQADHEYSWENFHRALIMMSIAAVMWMSMAFMGLKLFRRRKQK
jgi:hypothetical protein